MASELNDWNIDRDSAPNTDAPPDGAPENTTTFGDLNDVLREMMAVMARWYSDTSVGITTTGTAPAYVITPSRTISAYALGLAFRIKIHAVTATASSVSLNVSALGAKNLYDMHGNAIFDSQLVVDEWMDVVYDGTVFRKISGSAARFGPGHMHETDITLSTRSLVGTDHGKLLYSNAVPTVTVPATLADGFSCIIYTPLGVTITPGAGATIGWSDGAPAGARTFATGSQVVTLIKLGVVLSNEHYLGLVSA